MVFYQKNGHLFGVLIDFDLASLEGVPSQNQRRTGTRPFVAYRLLADGTPVSHVYKYGAESFFWVAVYDSASKVYGSALSGAKGCLGLMLDGGPTDILLNNSTTFSDRRTHTCRADNT